VGGVRMVVPEGLRSCLVHPGHAAGFSAQLVRLLGTPAERESAARVGREHVQRYDVGRVAPQLVEALCGC